MIRPLNLSRSGWLEGFETDSTSSSFPCAGIAYLDSCVRLLLDARFHL
jgi:hypothetical protein